MAAYVWEPAPLGGGRTGGVGAAAPRPQGGRLQLAPLMGGAEGGIFPMLDILSVSLTNSPLFVSVKSDVALS